MTTPLIKPKPPLIKLSYQQIRAELRQQLLDHAQEWYNDAMSELEYPRDEQAVNNVEVAYRTIRAQIEAIYA